jgi:hypothetical protein
LLAAGDYISTRKLKADEMLAKKDSENYVF